MMPAQKPETLIQSQQVTITGPIERVREVLFLLQFDAPYHKVTVTIHTPSVTDAIVGVTRDPQQNPQQWISVEERLPEMDGSWCLVYKSGYAAPEDNGVDTYTTQEQATWYGHLGRGARKPWGAGITHWMPLPEPPDAQGSVTEQSQQKSRQDGE